MSHHINLLRIKAIAGLLKQIKEEFVFVGGATVSLYGDENRSEARPTDDVDVVVELASYSGYSELDEKLRSVGFVNDMESNVICRYKIQGIIVDIMPTDASVIGFSNIWYQDGFKNAINIKIDDCLIKIFSLPYFIASKIEAFKSRGLNNYLFSSDFEDIVYVLENNSNVLNLIKYHAEKNDAAFRNEAYQIAKYFDEINNYQLAEYIMALLSDTNTFSPQTDSTIHAFFKKIELN